MTATLEFDGSLLSRGLPPGRHTLAFEQTRRETRKDARAYRGILDGVPAGTLGAGGGRSIGGMTVATPL